MPADFRCAEGPLGDGHSEAMIHNLGVLARDTVRMNVGCPHCRGVVAGPPELQGRVIACPHCGGQFIMPAEQPAQERPLAPPDANQPAFHQPGPDQPAPHQPGATQPASVQRVVEAPVAYGPPPAASPASNAAPTQPGGPPTLPAAPRAQAAAPRAQHAPAPAPPQATSAPVRATPATPATPARPAPLRAVPTTPASYGPPPPAMPAAPASTGGSGILAERRSRRRRSVLSTLLLVFFTLAAIGCSGGIVSFLWLYSTVVEVHQSNQAPVEQARNVAAAQLERYDVFDFEPHAEVTFYDDGCIVKGRGRSKTYQPVSCEVSIEILETKNRETWTVDYIVLNGETVYSRKAE